MAKPTEKDPFADCLIDHHRLVNNPNLFPDVFFQVDEKHELSAHYFVLKARLPQLLDDCTGLKKKKQKKKDSPTYLDVVKDQNITFEALERVLTFAYTGTLNYQTLTPNKAVEVMRASIVFKIPRLLGLSSKFLQDSLAMDNIFDLLKFSDGLDVAEAKTICIDFALQKPDFFTSGNAENLGFKLYQEVTSLLLKNQGGGKKELMTIDLSAEDTMVRDFKQIRGSTGDLAFTIKGEEVKVHKAMLSDQSPEFAALIQTYESSKDPKKPSNLTLEEKYSRITRKAFEGMLNFVYSSDPDIDTASACELIPFAKDFKLTKFCSTLEKIVGGNDISVPTCLAVLDVAYNPLMTENLDLQRKLKQEGLDFAVYNLDKIDFKPLETMNAQIGSHILQRLQQTIGNKWSASGVGSSWAAAPSTKERAHSGVALGEKKLRTSNSSLDHAGETSEKGEEADEKTSKSRGKSKSTKRTTKTTDTPTKGDSGPLDDAVLATITSTSTSTSSGSSTKKKKKEKEEGDKKKEEEKS